MFLFFIFTGQLGSVVYGFAIKIDKCYSVLTSHLQSHENDVHQKESQKINQMCVFDNLDIFMILTAECTIFKLKSFKIIM